MRAPEYQKVVDRYPADYGDLKGKALEAVEEYHDLNYPNFGKLSDSEIHSLIARKKAIDEDSEISKRLTHTINGGRPKEVAKALYLGLCKEHRTLQAQAIKTILELLKLYKDTNYDLRNHAAVVAAAVISEAVEHEELYIPLI